MRNGSCRYFSKKGGDNYGRQGQGSEEGNQEEGQEVKKRLDIWLRMVYNTLIHHSLFLGGFEC